MVIRDLKTFIIIYLVVLGFIFFLSIKYRTRFWSLFGRVLFPFISTALILYNLTKFPAFNQIDIPPYYQARLQRLSTKALVDLFDNSITKARSYWIYTLVEVYYQGKTLLIPEYMLDSLDLSLERLQNQGRLADIQIIESNDMLTAGNMEMILELDYTDLNTKEGDYFHFITQELEPDTPLLLLKYDNHYYFIPEDLLLDFEGGL